MRACVLVSVPVAGMRICGLLLLRAAATKTGGLGWLGARLKLLCDTFPCLPFETQSVALAFPFALPLLVQKGKALIVPCSRLCFRPW